MLEHAPCAMSCAQPTFSKAPRATLRRLSVEASECEQFLPRLLGIVANYALIPASIDYARTADGLRVDIVVADVDERTAGLLEGRIGRLIQVRQTSVTAVDCPR